MSARILALMTACLLGLGACGSDGNAQDAQTTGGSRTDSGSGQIESGNGGADGKQLFTSNGCGGCHTLKAAGSQSSTGPDLDAQLPKDAKKAGKDLAAFTKESIVNPSAYIADGFSDNIMPQTFKDSLSDEQLDALVKFITGG